MFFLEALTAFIIALLLTGLFVGLVGWRRPHRAGGEGAIAAAAIFFFAILFLGTWAGGAWLPAMGPPLWGVPWLTFLFFGLVIALLLAAAAPPPRVPRAESDVVAETGVAAGIGIFFWFLLLLLLVAIGASYVY